MWPSSLPIALNANTLRKLAPVLNGRSFLTVDRNDKGALVVWGIALVGREGHEIYGRTGHTGHLVVRSRGPGVLEVEQEGYVLWRFERGAGEEPGHWLQTARILARGLECPADDWRVPLLMGLARRIAIGGHGGTVAIVEPSNLNAILVEHGRLLDPPFAGLQAAHDRYAEDRAP
jgi:hypothetical protein